MEHMVAEHTTEIVERMNAQKIWIGIAIGAAIGLGFAVSRRKKSDPWSSARQITRRVSEHSGDLADAGKNILDRIRTIYEESRKVVDEATELWTHGRKLVGR